MLFRQAKYPLETAKILHRDIFWFFMKDKDFVTKTVNVGNVDIQKFPASKVQQLVKKMESSKATAKHMRQVAGDLPAAEIHLIHHKCTKLPARNYNKHKKPAKQRPQNCRPEQMAKKSFDLQKLEKPSDKCIRCSDTSHDLHIGQEVRSQDPTTKRWFPATIKALCPEPRSYHIETSDGVTYRRTQNHLKPYKSHQKTPRREQSNQDIDHKQINMNQISVKNTDNTKQSHPKIQIKIPKKLNLKSLKIELTNVQSYSAM